MKRSSARHRELAAEQLRFWHTYGELGICDLAWDAVERAAKRYGYESASAASHAEPTVMQDLFSEAIEDLESPE